MKKRFSFLILWASLFLTGCVSVGPLYYRTTDTGYDDYSYEVYGDVKSEGMIAYDKDKTWKDYFTFWHKYPEVIRNATDDDVIVYTKKIKSGFFEISLLGQKIKKWMGKYEISNKGKKQFGDFTIRMVGPFFVEVLDRSFSSGKIEFSDTSFYQRAPFVDAVYTASNGKKYLLQKTYEYHWESTDGSSYESKYYPHSVSSDSKVQITDVDNYVLADVYFSNRYFKIYTYATDEDEMNVRDFIGLYFSWDKFTDVCSDGM